MSRSCVRRWNQFGQLVVRHWTARGLAAAALAGFILLPSLAVAQGKSTAAQGKSKKTAIEPEKKTGKIADVEKKGRASTLTIEEADGEKFDVMVTGKMKFVVNAKGDTEFFKHPRTFVSSDSIVYSNNKFFGKKFTVHLGNTPAAVVEPDPDNAEVYNIAGPIVDSDETSFTITANGSPYKVNFEQGAAVDVAVESTEPEHAAVGSAIEVEGNSRGGKFHPTSVVVTLEKPLVAEEVFAAEKKPGKKSAKATKKSTKIGDKTAKDDKGDAAEKTDDPSGEPLKPASDPFGVLDKKDAKKKPSGTKPKKKPAEGNDVEK